MNSPTVPSYNPLASIVLDRDSPVPLYFQLAQQIENEIHVGGLRTGDRLENEVKIAEDLGLSLPRTLGCPALPAAPSCEARQVSTWTPTRPRFAGRGEASLHQSPPGLQLDSKRGETRGGVSRGEVGYARRGRVRLESNQTPSAFRRCLCPAVRCSASTGSASHPASVPRQTFLSLLPESWR